MFEELHTIDVSPEDIRTDYLHEMVTVFSLAQLYLKDDVFDTAAFNAHLKDALDELGRDEVVCSFEKMYQHSPEIVLAQPVAFLHATRFIADEFNDLYSRRLLTLEIIGDLSGRLERLKRYPEAELSSYEFMEVMASELAVTMYIQDMSALYSVANAMVQQREKVRQLGMDEHILDFFDGKEGFLVLPFSKRFQDEPHVLKNISPEFVRAFDDLAEVLNQRFRDRTLVEDDVVDIFGRMEALKKELIAGYL